MSIDEGTASWGVENGNAGDDVTNVVSERIGGVPTDDPIARLVANGPTRIRSGDTIVSAIPIGDPGVGGWYFAVLDEGTPCVRLLSTPTPFELDEAAAYAQELADNLHPPL